MTINSNDFDFIREMLFKHSAIVLDDSKTYLVDSRLGTVARNEGIGSLEELVEKMRRQPFNGLHWKVIEAMTTNETSFFRDIHPFEALKKVVVPELIARRQTERELRIWCGACSSGQEPYSILMLLRENFPLLAGWNIQLIATDISNEMLQRSREGCYRQMEINRGLPAALVVKYFQRLGVEWQIKEEIRRMVQFSQINLSGAWMALPMMDIVMMRNVLIYFDLETKRTILGKVRRLLKPDGYLFLGGAETTLNLDDSYERVPVGKTVCYKVGATK